jgi:phage replication O-like protein O
MSPQKENGYTPIANELFEAFYRCKLLEYERVVVMCLWRKTYGWSKNEDWVSNSQIEEETGIALPNITRTLNSLKVKKIVLQNGRKLRVNKYYKEWIVEWRRLSHQITKVISPDNQRLSHQIPTKAIKQITKEGKTSLPHLKENNNQDMGWNNKSEDYEEGVVDYESGELKEEKNKPARKYPNAPAVRKLFQEILGVNPAHWNKNVTVLQSCENLFTERGIEKVRNALEFYKEHKDTEFCPVINSPTDLDRKYTNLSQFKNSL